MFKGLNHLSIYNYKGTSGLVISTRSDYGGRNSLVTLMLPSLVFSLMLVSLWIFHSCSYGSMFYFSWVCIGFVLMITDWYRSGLLESRFQNTISYKINAMGSFIYLIVFESLFFIGTYWLMCISRIHGVSDVSFKSCTSGSDLSLTGSWESNIWNFNSESMDTFGLIWMSHTYSVDFITEIMLPISLNLWYLLLVSMLLQYAHRMVQIRELVI
jgi:hypothetical protein